MRVLSEFESEPEWAVLAKVDAAQLGRIAGDALSEEFGDAWELVQGDGWSAVSCLERWALGSAEHYSSLLRDGLGVEVFQLYFDDDIFVVRRFTFDGDQVDVSDDPFEFARERGFEGEFLEPLLGPTVRSAFVVEGVSPAEVGVAIDASGLQITGVGRGVVVTGDPGSQSIDVVEKLPGVRVFDVSHHVEPGRFVVRVYQGFDNVSVFMLPPNCFETEDKIVDSILGETDPMMIARKLDIPPDALALPVG